jgi:hypothetical protein
MKTSLLPLALLCFFIANDATAKAHSPPPALADTITVQFNTGYGMDCNGTGRQCLSAQPMAIGQQVSPTSQGVAKAWFDGQGHFIMEVRQVFSTSLYNELEGGTFLLEANIPVPEGIMVALGRQGQLYLLTSGVHTVSKQPDSSYKIVF